MTPERIAKLTSNCAARHPLHWFEIQNEELQELLLAMETNSSLHRAMTTAEKRGVDKATEESRTKIEALSAALRDAVNVFLDADKAPGEVLCTGERREAWEETLRVHGFKA